MTINWVKKLGQAHHSIDGETLCGVPCLGNNYVDVIDEKDYDICNKCEEAYNDRSDV